MSDYVLYLEEAGQHGHLPKDVSLPFFAYGNFQVSELAYKQIQRAVEKSERHELDGFELKVADGLTYAVANPKSHIVGDLIWMNERGYAIVSKFENTPSLYKWLEVEVPSGIRANLLVAAKNIATRHDVKSSWSCTDDTILSHTIPWVERKLVPITEFIKGRRMDDPLYGPFERLHFVELQSVFTMLWVLFERVTLFEEGPLGPNKHLSDRVRQVLRIPEWQEAIARVKLSNVGARAHSEIAHNPTYAGQKSFEAWIRWRNNVVHRGKSAQKEFTALADAAIDMTKVMRIYLETRLPQLKEYWGSAELQKNLDSYFQTRQDED